MHCTKRIAIILISTGILSACETNSADDAVTSLSSVQTGEIVFWSTSPYSAQEAVAGTGGAKDRVLVSADLNLPGKFESDERIPAMVLVHGSGGRAATNPAWKSMFRELGIATFEVDSFAGRGISSTVGNQSRVRATMMVSDAFNALELLATHPNIDPARIGIMGWSKGGLVSIFTAWEPRRRSEIDGDLKFALHIPVYPACVQFDRFEMTGKPMLLLLGEQDNWISNDSCIEMADSIRATGNAIETEVYEGAHHSFDSTRERVITVGSAWSFQDCDFRVTENGSEYEATTGGTMNDPDGLKQVVLGCAKKGAVKAGGNTSARKRAFDRAEEFVTKVLGLQGAD
ncbi:MAG: dienelactone hydrolase family protein [Geminicoccaceae bacterium]